MYTSGSARALYALLFLIVTGQSNAQSLAASDVTETTPLSAAPGLGSTSAPALAAATGAPEYIYEVGREYNLTCILPAVDVKTIVWFKNNTQVQSKERVVIEGAVLRYNGKWQEEDYGEYACSAGGVNQTFYVRAKVHPKLPANSNVVEGQNLRLTCKLLGKPYPMVHWLFSNETVTNMSVIELLGQRAVYNDTIRAAENELLLKEVQRWDAGNYTCYVTEPFAMNSTTIVRVKDKYAALWPFLGICIEVFVLCAIILVYEKRRTKPELDDSDTDNHDQKKS